MKRLFTILAMAALAATASLATSCEGPMGPQGIPGRDGEVQRISIDNIDVYPEQWQAYIVDGYFDHYYVDISLPELSSYIFSNGFYYTYWKYADEQILVQEGEGATMHLERLENGVWVTYSETISCSYEVGYMRIVISRSDFYDARPGTMLTFRFVAFW